MGFSLFTSSVELKDEHIVCLYTLYKNLLYIRGISEQMQTEKSQTADYKNVNTIETSFNLF